MTGFAEAPDRPWPELINAAAPGLASGFLSAVMFRFEIDPIFWTGVSETPFLGLRTFPYPILIALCFAGAIALVSRRVLPRRWWTPPLLAGGIYLAGMLAIRSAVAVTDALRAPAGDIPALAAGGAVAGLIGATVMVLTVAALVPQLRSRGSLAVALAGLVTGPLLAVPFGVNEADLWRLALLFMPWQGAVTAALGWRIRANEGEAVPASTTITAQAGRLRPAAHHPSISRNRRGSGRARRGRACARAPASRRGRRHASAGRR
jgi:hypothetical protein